MRYVIFFRERERHRERHREYVCVCNSDFIISVAIIMLSFLRERKNKEPMLAVTGVIMTLVAICNSPGFSG